MEDKSRSLYTHEEYISLVLNSGSGLSHDYVSQSIQEDPRMMAFFDSLVRREIEGWSSDSDSDLSEEAIMQLNARGRRTTRATPTAATAAPATTTAGRRSDSDNSSSSSLAGPSGGEEATGDEVAAAAARQRRRSRQQRLQSGFPANEDSDSSEFWLDPMPRPLSPSPRRLRSTLSSLTSSPSLPAGASSSSSSTSSSSSSSSSSDDEERRSAVRRRNVARRCRAHVVSRAGDRPVSVQALFTAIDSCSYPSISIDELSSSSSSPVTGEEQNSLSIKPRCSGGEDKSLSPSEFVCLSPDASPEEGRGQSSPLPSCGLRTGDGGGEASTEEVVDSSDGSGGEACSSSGVLDSSSRSQRSGGGGGANGQHRTVAACSSGNLLPPSESEEETEDTKPRRVKEAEHTPLKRTHVVSEEGGSSSSPSEKKLKT